MTRLTDAQCDEFRRMPGSFNDMVRAIFTAGASSERARISTYLRRAGADLPAPENKGTIASALTTGLSIALAVVEVDEILRSKR